ncbi:MAG: hypothetical protein M3Z06_00650 [Actinomycetota bacterium]|nr:hypothetical protein [Actinomycetota bacterium]
MLDNHGASSWTIEPSPTPEGPAASLAGVSCTTAASCVAVGTSFTSGFVRQVPLAEQRRAGVWRIRPVPAPTESGGAELSGVSCQGHSCTAVGTSLGTDRNPGRSKVLIERWNGASWQIQPAPSPSGLGTSALSAVSCPSANRCKAVGITQEQFGPSAALAESWNGHSWSIDSMPPRSNGLSGVSCTSPNACTAVGSVATNDGQAAIAERWNGREWTIQSTPAVAQGDNFTSLNAVSCAASLACTAVGAAGNASHGLITSTLAEAWRGHAWFVQPTFSLGISALNGVSCTRPDACTAVGDDEAAPSVGTTIQRWDGREWVVQRNPLDNAPATLSSVSCPTLQSCTAVGSSPTLTTLVERYTGS